MLSWLSRYSLFPFPLSTFRALGISTATLNPLDSTLTTGQQKRERERERGREQARILLGAAFASRCSASTIAECIIKDYVGTRNRPNNTGLLPDIIARLFPVTSLLLRVGSVCASCGFRAIVTILNHRAYPRLPETIQRDGYLYSFIWSFMDITRI